MTTTYDTVTITVDSTEANLILAALYAYATEQGAGGFHHTAARLDRLAANVAAQRDAGECK